MPDGGAAAALLMLALMPGQGAGKPALPQAGQCRLPATIRPPHFEQPESRSDVRRMPIGGYTLALSWSPEFCAGQVRGPNFQCHGGNHFGFIPHGLWPEGRGNGWPQWCSPAVVIPRDVLRENLCAMPGEQLMQHQWAKHGSCMANTPKAYFDRARRLYQRLRFPDMNWLAGRYRLTAGDVAGAFARANPGMRIEMMRVRAGDNGALSEVYICLDAAFQPARCPAGKGGLSQNARIRIRSAR